MIQRILDLQSQGWDKQRIANTLGLSRGKVQRLLRKHRDGAVSAPPADKTTVEQGDQRTVEVRIPRLIETEEEAIAAAGVDLTVWERDRLEIRHYPISVGEGVITQGTYVKVGLRRRQVVDVAASVATMVDAAITQRGHRAPMIYVPTPERQLLDVVVIADPHFGKYAWSGSTGHDDYDLDIARSLTWQCANDLLTSAPRCRERVIAFLGDVFHYDTPSGTTTGGTTLDRDSRHHKMLTVGTGVCARIVRASAQSALTRVVIVPGNHDEILTAALHCVMTAEFRRDERVRVAETVTKRQYLEWGGNLLGFDHGDKNKKSLPKAMQTEQRAAWGRTRYAEWHTGHLHQEQTVTDMAVVVRTHRSVTPPDQWHADHNFIGAARGMQAFTYHHAGGLTGMRTADPHLLTEAAA